MVRARARVRVRGVLKVRVRARFRFTLMRMLGFGLDHIVIIHIQSRASPAASPWPRWWRIMVTNPGRYFSRATAAKRKGAAEYCSTIHSLFLS